MSYAKSLKHAKSKRRRQKKAVKAEAAALPRCPHGLPLVKGDFPAACWTCLDERKKAMTKKEPVVFPLNNGACQLGAAVIFLPEPAPSKCCGGRMAAMLVNRDGSTRCTECDLKYVRERDAKEA